MNNENRKKIFLIISSDVERLSVMEEVVNRHYFRPTIYKAPNGYTGEVMIQNSAIDVVFFDIMEGAAEEFKLIDFIINKKELNHVSFILLGHHPVEDVYVEELLNGRMMMIDRRLSEDEFSKALSYVLNYNAHAEPATYYLKFLAPGETLIREGEVAHYVYILRTGLLQAHTTLNDKKIVLGDINEGEFVGEMAYINNEPRTATITALKDSELVEIPIGIIDKILFKKPAWAKTLMKTLSKRLKDSNKRKVMYSSNN